MTHHFLYWLGTGWWCLGLAHAPLLCTSKTCPLLMRLPWFGGLSAHPAAHPWLLMAWAIFWFLILYGMLPLGAGLRLIMGFLPSAYSFTPSVVLLPFLSYYSAIFAVMSFDPNLLGLFGSTAYSSLNDSIWSLDSYSCYFGLFYYITCGLPCLIYFFLGILSPFAFLGHLWLFFLIPRSYELLLTLLGFPSPITLSFILGAHGLSTNLLLSLLALFRTCCGPFSLFYITYCPWVCYFSLQAPLGPFASLRPIYLFYGPMIHYSCHLGLMVFLSTH